MVANILLYISSLMPDSWMISILLCIKYALVVQKLMELGIVDVKFDV